MKQLIYFYKELTSAEVGNTKTHEIYIRMPNNFDHEAFFGNMAVMNDQVLEVTFTAQDLTNGGNEPISLRYVYYQSSNQEKRIPSLGSLFKSHDVQEGDIVCLVCEIENSSRSYLIRFYKKGEIRINPSSIYFSKPDDEDESKSTSISFGQPLQQIFYGAPGTGKSNTIKREVDNQHKTNFRVTFHPDSDYSTFVGCYKPTMKKNERVYSQSELVLILKDIKNSGVTYPCQKFATKYWKSLTELEANSVLQILTACGFQPSMTTEVSKGIAIGQAYMDSSTDGKIVYEFVPQAFTKAYTAAWNTEEEVYLIIEEINRGNCAQIFGDLFQLLDRKNGISEYPVDADSDLADYIQNALSDSTRTDFPEGVKEGKKLVLPKNLYIWATMNTSDQSLFPIDSAFKRRWDWKYMKIAKGKDKDGNDLDWKIVVKDKEGYAVKINNEESLPWWDFIRKINDIIASMTSSADKQLGYFFCKAKNGIIDEETFVSKVIFYLWNDVFKDYGFEDASLFQYKDDKGEPQDLTFPDFYDDEGKQVNTVRLKDFIENVMNWKKEKEEQK